MDDDLKALEAVLFAADQPLGRAELARALGSSELELADRLERYRLEVAGRGFMLQEEPEGLILLSRPEFSSAVAASQSRQSRTLSMASLETLAVIAYRQPVTRSVIERLRGVRSERSLALLEEEGLIAEAGHLKAPGQPVLWRTTEEFRRRFNLRSASDLPALSEEMRRRIDAWLGDGEPPDGAASEPAPADGAERAAEDGGSGSR